MATLQSLTVDDTGHLTLPSGVAASRPTITTTVVTPFTTTTSTTWTCPANVTQVEVLVVAGGGGGGGIIAGGGGAGGVVYVPNYAVTPGTVYTVVVGAGGTGGVGWNNPGQRGIKGNNSQFDQLVAQGGSGGGAHGGASSTDTEVGGSTGGTSSGAETSIPITGQGHRGGRGDGSAGGGGGGAGGAGQNGQSTGVVSVSKAGDGGPGLLFSISGTPTYYAGGGGGGGRDGSVFTTSRGGVGGGTAGTNPTTKAADAAANTGGGGGGGGYSGSSASQMGGNGGSGIVIIRYSLNASNASPEAYLRYNSGAVAAEVFPAANSWKFAQKSDPIVTNGMLVHFDVENYSGSGTSWYDISGNGYVATMSNLTSANWVTYGGVRAWETTNVSNQNFTVASYPFPSTNGRTYEVWWNAKSYSLGHWQSWFDDGSTERVLFGTPSNGVQCYPDVNAAVGLQVGRWYHLAYTMSPGTVGLECKIYVDGRLVTTGTWNGNASAGLVTGTGTLYMFGDSGGECSSGYYAIARTYSRPLSEIEILQNYNAQAYRFNQGELTNSTDAVGLSPSNPAASGTALWDHGYRSSGWYWIARENSVSVRGSGANGSMLVYVDLQTIEPTTGKAGWMLVASWDLAAEWTKDSVSTSVPFGEKPRNAFSSNFGNFYINFMRVKVASGIDCAPDQSEADFYYYWNNVGGIQWKTVWAAGSGANTHYNSVSTAIARRALKQFTHAYNIKFGYQHPNQVWANLSDNGTSGATGTEGWADWYTGLTSAGTTLGVYSFGGTLDGSLAVVPSGNAAVQAGQDCNDNNAKYGYDDNIQTYWAGSYASESLGANTGTRGNHPPMWMWIK
jgi:hypothetical protein